MDRIRKLIEKIEKYGIDNNVPIMSKDTIIELNKIINNEKVTSILEIGTAIGYSTICFANNENIKKVISIERDNLRYSIAKKNVLESNLSNIKLINDDAFNIEFNNEKFDLIIIDAAKAQNKKLFLKFKDNINEKGIIIIDNLNFHGLVGKSNEIKSKNLRGLVRKIEEFIDYLNKEKEFEKTYIEVGDTIVVCKKRNL